jgi:hypothetical protein
MVLLGMQGSAVSERAAYRCCCMLLLLLPAIACCCLSPAAPNDGDEPLAEVPKHLGLLSSSSSSSRAASRKKVFSFETPGNFSTQWAYVEGISCPICSRCQCWRK